MIYGLHKLRVFIGGPDDTGAESTITARAARVLAAHYERTGQFEIEVYRWNGEDRATAFGAQEDGQGRIDAKLSSDKADIVIVVFKDRLGTPTRRGGQDYASYSAYELETALAASGPSKPRTAVLRFNLRQEEEAKLTHAAAMDLTGKALQKRLKELKAGKDSRRQIEGYLNATRARFERLNVMTYESTRAFENLVGDFLAGALFELSQLPPPPVEPPSPMPPRADRVKFPGYPFRSMQSLGYDDHDLFHGRDAKVAELAGRLRDPRVHFLCLAGPSGAGKSSLLKAGLIGDMIARRHADRDAPLWLIDMQPGRDPFDALEKAVGGIACCSGGKQEHASPIRTAALGRLLSENCRHQQRQVAETLERFVIQPLRSLGRGREPDILLVVDQLEELWTKAEDQGERREAFLRLLAAAVGSANVRVLATLRSDMIPSFEEAKLVAEILGGGSGAIELLTPPTIQGELEPMIRETARAGGIVLEEALIGALLTDAEGVGPAALPLVAFTLSELVQRADGLPVTFGAYRAIGRLPGAIETTVQAALDRYLPGESGTGQRLARLFTRLVSVRDSGPEPAPVREARRKADLVQHGAANSLIDALIEARVLHIGDAGGDTVSLAHDALFQIWGPLRDWVAANRMDLAFRAALLRDAAEWRRHGERQRFIKLGPEALNDAQTRVEERPDLFADDRLVGDYLRAAARREDKVRFIQAINASSLAEALDALARHQGDLGLNRYEDCGTNAGQLRMGIYAAVTGDDSPEERLAPQLKEEEPPPAKQGTGPAQFVEGAKEAQQRGVAEQRSIFQEPEHREVTVTRGRGPLHLAAMFGHLALVRRLIELGASPHKKTSGGQPLLGDAAFGGHLEMVRFLAEEVGLNVREPYADGTEPLLWACQRGHEAVVDYLLSRGASFDMRVEGGWTCLTEAARGGHLRLVRRLVEQENFPPDQRTAGSTTPLHCAARGNDARHLEVVRYLCTEARADRAAVDDTNSNALNWAATDGTAAMVSLLLSLGVDPNLADVNGWTPLHTACARGSLSVVRALLASEDVDLDACNAGGFTPLALAASHGHDRIVQALLVRGADPTKKEAKGWTALHLAVDDSDLAVIDLLCDRKSSRILNARIEPGWTALMLAADRGRPEMITRLRRAGASLHLRDAQGNTALHFAVGKRQPDAVRALLDPMSHERLLRSFVDAPNASGATPLLIAAQAGLTEICRMLLAAGADPDGRPSGDFLLPALAARGDVEGCAALLPECHNPNARDANGSSALGIAAASGNVELCRVLLKDPRVKVDARRWRSPALAEDDDAPEPAAKPDNAASSEKPRG